MGVSLCYLRGGSIGAFGWGLLRLLVSDFCIGSERRLRKNQFLPAGRQSATRYAIDDGVLPFATSTTTNPKCATRTCSSSPRDNP